MKKQKKTVPDTREKLENICVWLAEKKATEIVALDLSSAKTAGYITEGIIVAGAGSLRHGQGLADFALEKSKEHNYEFFQMEGYKNGLWILLDFNDVVVNIFQNAQREIYRLEDLYPGATLLRDERQKS